MSLCVSNFFWTETLSTGSQHRLRTGCPLSVFSRGFSPAGLASFAAGKICAACSLSSQFQVPLRPSPSQQYSPALSDCCTWCSGQRRYAVRCGAAYGEYAWLAALSCIYPDHLCCVSATGQLICDRAANPAEATISVHLEAMSRNGSCRPGAPRRKASLSWGLARRTLGEEALGHTIFRLRPFHFGRFPLKTAMCSHLPDAIHSGLGTGLESPGCWIVVQGLWQVVQLPQARGKPLKAHPHPHAHPTLHTCPKRTLSDLS